MIKNDENKKGLGRIPSDEYNSNSNEFSSAPTSLQKKFRKDGKGNLILKKKFPIKKTKHHAYLIDVINPEKNVADIIDVESYKKYNLDEDEEIEEENKENEEKLEESKTVIIQGCCIIF